MKQLTFKEWIHRHRLYDNEECNNCDIYFHIQSNQCKQCPTYQLLLNEYEDLKHKEKIKHEHLEIA